MLYKQGIRDKGFTLIELVIAMVILSILSMVAFPGYQQNVRKARRVDGKAMLMKVSQNLERCYTEYNNYNGDDDSDGTGNCPHVDVTSGVATIDFLTDEDNGDGYYRVSSVDNDGTETLTLNSYTLYARPTNTGHQDKDLECAQMSLDSVGRKKSYQDNGTENSRCW